MTLSVCDTASYRLSFVAHPHLLRFFFPSSRYRVVLLKRVCSLNFKESRPVDGATKTATRLQEGVPLTPLKLFQKKFNLNNKMPPVPTPVELLAKLDRCLIKFDAHPGDKCDFYTYHPDEQSALLGKGAYGAAYRMKSKSTGKIVIVKEIAKSRVTRDPVQVQHLGVEIAVTRMVQHPILNHCVDLIHNDQTVFIVLEACDSSKGDLSTRLYFLMAKYYPARIGDVPRIVKQFEDEAADRVAKLESSPEEERSIRAQLEEQVVRKTCSELGVRNEDPVESDLFGAIVHARRIPEGKAAVIVKQILEGLQHLHSLQIVHRDMKTENIVLGERRRAVAVMDATNQNVVGVRLIETVDVRIIDFGLAKYLDVTSSSSGGGGPVPTPSPSQFATSDNPWDRVNSDVFDLTPNSGGTNLSHPSPGSYIPVTPCGTEIYCSLEVLDGIIGGNSGRQHWVSSKRTLPKLDIHGAGTALFCMLNGRPPFRAPNNLSRNQRDDRLRAIRHLVAQGATFSSTVSESAKAFCEKLMINEVALRPEARASLADPFLQSVTRRYITEVTCDGERRPVIDVQAHPIHGGSGNSGSSHSAQRSESNDTSPASAERTSEAIPAVAEETDEDVAAALRQGEADLNEALRHAEDDGDSLGKGCAEEEN